MELVIQGRFLQPTVNPLFMGAELVGPAPFTLQLSWLKRSLIGMVAQLISSFIPNVKWTLGDKATGEFPMISFPLVKAMDRIHATPLSTPAAAPVLGWQQLPPSPPAFSKSALTLSQRFSPSELYSFDFFSNHLDLCRWKAVNVRDSLTWTSTPFGSTTPPHGVL